jgi:hypothetical protein
MPHLDKPTPWPRGWRPILLLALWGGLAPCLAQPGLQPLVKLHDTRVNAAGPTLIGSTDDDLLITVDGSLVSTAVTRRFLPGSRFQTTIAMGNGSPAAVAALNRALAAGHPAQLSGTCAANNLLPLGSSCRYRITWFGSHSRTSTFTLTNEGDGTTVCTPDQIAIATAILTFESAVLADPSTRFLRSSCASDNDCAAGELCCYPCGIPGCSNVCTPIAPGGRCPALP